MKMAATLTWAEDRNDAPSWEPEQLEEPVDPCSSLLFSLSTDLSNPANSVSMYCKMLQKVLRELTVDDARASEIELSLRQAASDAAFRSRAGSRCFFTIELYVDRLSLKIRNEGPQSADTAGVEPEQYQARSWDLWLPQPMADVGTVWTDGGCQPQYGGPAALSQAR